MLGLLTQSL